MESPRYFRPSLFGFLRDLKANNNRDWFNANKQRYERDVREPALQLIRDFEPHLHAISPYFRADDRKVGGSLFRIYRDVRFSKDKSPYKTHTGIQFRHAAGKDAHAPGYYLHLEPRNVFVGLGIWHPDSATLRKIRGAIVDDPAGWRQVLGAPEFGDTFQLAGDSLKRPPQGVAADHPLVQDLKRKDFIAITALSHKQVTSPGFIHQLADLCRIGSTLVEFLCDVLEIDF